MIAAIMAALLYCAGLEAPIALGDQDNLARAAVDDGAVRYRRYRLVLAGTKHHVGIHAGLYLAVRIVQLDANGDGARLRLHHLRVDERHRAVMRGVGKRSERHGGGHAELDLGDIGFGDLGDHPDAAMVGNAEKLVSGGDALALDHAFFDDVAGRGRRPVDGSRVGQGRAHFLDAAVGHIDIAQFLHGPLQAPLRLGFGRAALRPHGHHEVGLRQLNLRAVEAEQRLALFDVLSRLVDEQLLDVTIGAYRNDRKQRLVVLHGADPAYGAGDGQARDLLRPHSRALDLVEADLDGVRIVLLVRIDRDVVHAHGVLLRHRRGIRKSHGIAVIENRPLSLGGLRLGGQSRCCDRLGTMRVPIARGGTGGDAGNQYDQSI
jgi:hypothetical protein